MTDLLKFAVEEDDRDAKRYKRIHRADCPDLIDGAPIYASSFEELAYEAVGYGVVDTEDEIDEVKAAMKPCAVHHALIHGWQA